MANEVGVVYVSIMPTTDGFTRAVNRDITGPLDSAAGRGEKSFGRMFRRVAAVAGGVLAAIGLGKLVKETISLGVSYNTLEQTSRAAFTTILGSAEAAAGMMKDLREFAKTSPFPRQAYISAAQQMAAFGIQSQKVIPYLDAITDAVAAAGGSGQELSEISFVMSQISAAGKITGQDLIQFGQRGINAAELIGSQMGKTGAEIKEEITKGTLGADEALDALATGMAKKFGGAADNVKNTWLGSVDRIKGAWRDISSILIAPFIDPEGGGYAVKWANMVADSLRWLESSDLLKDFRGKLRDIAGSMDDVFNKISIAAPLLKMDDGLSKFVDALGDMFPAIGFISTIAEALAPVLPALADGLVDVAKALLAEGVIDALVTLITEVLPPLADLLVAIVPLVPPLAEAFTTFLIPVVHFLADGLGGVTDKLSLLTALFNGDLGFDAFVEGGRRLVETGSGVEKFILGLIDTTADFAKGLYDFNRTVGTVIYDVVVIAFSRVKLFINNIIGAVNKAIRGLNGMIGTVGGALGFSVTIPTIPHLADSGTVLPRPGGTLILAAEAGRAESVVDTGKLNGLIDAAAKGGGSASDRPIYADGIGLIGWMREVVDQQAQLIFNTQLRRSYAAGR